MYRKVSDFITDYETESKKTLTVFHSISNEFLSSKVDPKGMSLGELSLHIVQAIEKITSQIGINFSSLTQVELPKEIQLISDLYKRAVDTVIEFLADKSDSFLEKEFSVYGTSWTVGQTLTILVKHEIHHRGQIVLGLRVLGLSVPDIYGPARKAVSS